MAEQVVSGSLSLSKQEIESGIMLTMCRGKCKKITRHQALRPQGANAYVTGHSKGRDVACLTCFCVHIFGSEWTRT